MKKQRNNKGQFVSRQKFIQDQVSLTNDFKGLEIHQDRPTKPVNVVLIVMIMAVIFGAIVLLDKCKVIELVSNGGF